MTDLDTDPVDPDAEDGGQVPPEHEAAAAEDTPAALEPTEPLPPLAPSVAVLAGKDPAPKPASTKSFPSWMEDLRAQLADVEDQLHTVGHHTLFSCSQKSPGQHDRVRSRVAQAIGHVEDARMRLGKAILVANGDES